MCKMPLVDSKVNLSKKLMGQIESKEVDVRIQSVERDTQMEYWGRKQDENLNSARLNRALRRHNPFVQSTAFPVPRAIIFAPSGIGLSDTLRAISLCVTPYFRNHAPYIRHVDIASTWSESGEEKPITEVGRRESHSAGSRSCVLRSPFVANIYDRSGAILTRIELINIYPLVRRACHARHYISRVREKCIETKVYSKLRFMRLHPSPHGSFPL